VNLFATTADGAQHMLRTTEELLEAANRRPATVLRVVVEKTWCRSHDLLQKLYNEPLSNGVSPVLKQIERTTNRMVHLGGIGLIYKSCATAAGKQFGEHDVLLRVEMDVPFRLVTNCIDDVCMSSVQVGPHLHVRDVTDFGCLRPSTIDVHSVKSPTKTVCYGRLVESPDRKLLAQGSWLSASRDSREDIIAVTKYYTTGFFQASQVEAVLGKEIYKSIVPSLEIQQRLEHFRQQVAAETTKVDVPATGLSPKLK
jgi:hypothetical protein